MTQPTDKKTLRVGLAGLGAVGLEVAKRLIAGVPVLTLAAVAVRDAKRRNGRCRRLVMTFPSTRPLSSQTTVTSSSMSPPALFREIAISAIDKGRIFMPLSVAQLLK
jgi:aspartate dehydrogenase